MVSAPTAACRARAQGPRALGGHLGSSSAAWSPSSTACTPSLRGTSASPPHATSGSSPTWTCSTVWWHLGCALADLIGGSVSWVTQVVTREGSGTRPPGRREWAGPRSAAVPRNWKRRGSDSPPEPPEGPQPGPRPDFSPTGPSGRSDLQNENVSQGRRQRRRRREPAGPSWAAAEDDARGL